MAIFDSQINSFVSYSSITIDMTHNTNGPVFQERPYRRDLTWRQLPGMLVPLLAIDADGVNIRRDKACI